MAQESSHQPSQAKASQAKYALLTNQSCSLSIFLSVFQPSQAKPSQAFLSFSQAKPIQAKPNISFSSLS